MFRIFVGVLSPRERTYGTLSAINQRLYLETATGSFWREAVIKSLALLRNKRHPRLCHAVYTEKIMLGETVARLCSRAKSGRKLMNTSLKRGRVILVAGQ